MSEGPVLFKPELIRAILAGKKTQTRRLHEIKYDTFWIREAWRIGAWNEDTAEVCIDYRADGFCDPRWRRVDDADVFERLWRQSTDDARKAGLCTNTDGKYRWAKGQAPTRWRSPLFMFQWAARRQRWRITRRRQEWLFDISHADAVAEGFANRREFYMYWDRINLLVWAHEFELIQEAT